MILCANPQKQYLARREAIERAVLNVMESGWYIHGPQHKQFEKDFSALIGMPFGVGVGNGTDAIELALRTLGVGSGDEVLTVSHSAVATVNAIVRTGATPVMVDIESDYYTMDPEAACRAITGRTKVILPVHIYGQSANMGALMQLAIEHGLHLVEDCAQAHGASYQGKKAGSWGVASAFSFYPTKNLGAMGDAGMALFADEVLAHKACVLREYGWEDRYISDCHGTNTRLDELQAAVLNVKLPFLEEDRLLRNKIAQRYNQAFTDLPLVRPAVRPDSDHAFHLYVIQVEQRDSMVDFMKERGVQCAIHYPSPIHQQKAYETKQKLEHTENLYKRIVSLPLYPELSEDDQAVVIAAVKQFFNN